MSILILYLDPGRPPQVVGQLEAQALQLPAACELQRCMQLQQFRYMVASTRPSKVDVADTLSRLSDFLVILQPDL